MDTILTIIVTVLAYQFINFLVCIVTHEDLEKMSFFIFGIFIPISKAATFIYNNLLLYHVKNNYSLYALYGDYNSDGYPIHLWDYYISNEVVKKYFKRCYAQDEKVTAKAYSIRKIRDGKTFKKCPCFDKLVTKKKIKKFGTIQGISRKEFSKFNEGE